MTAEGTTKGFRVTISLSDDPSKDEEIDAIVKLLQKFALAPNGRFYLSSLFTEDLTKWVAQRIRNDFPPDVWGEWQADVNVMQGQLRMATKEANDAKAALAVAVEAVEVTKREWAADGIKYERALTGTRADRDEATDLYRKYSQMHYEADTERKALAAQVVTLKAELYDAAKRIEFLTPHEQGE
jgi:hypothetical protein